MKHIEPEVVELTSYVHLKYNTSTGGIFRLPRGKSPMTVVRVMQTAEIVLIQCIYLLSGHMTVYTGDKEVVPLKLGDFEDDHDFTPKNITRKYYNEFYNN